MTDVTTTMLLNNDFFLFFGVKLFKFEFSTQTLLLNAKKTYPICSIYDVEIKKKQEQKGS